MDGWVGGGMGGGMDGCVHIISKSHLQSIYCVLAITLASFMFSSYSLPKPKKPKRIKDATAFVSHHRG